MYGGDKKKKNKAHAKTTLVFPVNNFLVKVTSSVISKFIYVFFLLQIAQQPSLMLVG